MSDYCEECFGPCEDPANCIGMELLETEKFTKLDRDIDDIWEKLRDLVREMDRNYGDEKIYESWLQLVSFQGQLADFVLQKMEMGEYES